MKNFNLASNKFFRKLIGFIILGIIVYFSIDYIESNLEVLIFLFGITFGIYFILEYAAHGNDEWVSIDFRSEQEKEDDEVNRKFKLLEAAKENLILEVASGNLNRREAEERLEGLLFLEQKMNTKLLTSPKQEEYV
jgi:hypothetical protein